jgi:flagella basal body P-ring formation protein FlgA
MIRTLLVLIAMAACGPAAAAQAVVRSDWISLKDVAPVMGEAGDILLGPAPPPGQTLALDPVFVVAVAKKSGVVIALPMDAPIWVKREALKPAGAAPQAKAAAVAAVAPPARTPPRAPEPVAVSSGEVLLLTRDLKRGEVIREEDLSWGPAPVGRVLRNAPTDAAPVIGKAARRSLSAGSPIETADVEAPDLVRKGEPVTLIYAAPGLRLSVSAVAQNDAGLGDGVRVLNLQSRRSIDATVSGQSEASVQKR